MTSRYFSKFKTRQRWGSSPQRCVLFSSTKKRSSQAQRLIVAHGKPFTTKRCSQAHKLKTSHTDKPFTTRTEFASSRVQNVAHGQARVQRGSGWLC